MIEVLPVGF
jgi:hypothetical protein